MRAPFFQILCVGFLFLGPAPAQATTYLKISSGTGFVINREGHLVTNAHVLKDCKSINVLTKDGPRNATLVTQDGPHDLAVLQVQDFHPEAFAFLRGNVRDLKVGDRVSMLGYPGEAGVEGEYRFKKTSVSSLNGPAGEPRWIQLESVAEHGNSGGPVLDAAGNVIAVVSGIAQTYHMDANTQTPPEFVSQSDIAITLPTLQGFLRAHDIFYYEAPSGLVAYGDGQLESRALGFTLPVRCIQGTEEH